MKQSSAARTGLTIDGTELEVIVTRKRVKNVNARLVGRCLRVSAPPSVPEDRLQSIIHQLAAKLVLRARARQVSNAAETAELARVVAARFPQPPAVTEVRFVAGQRRRWGSYSARTGIVRLNLTLSRMPRWVLEAVLAHELAHASHPNHSAAFRALLERACPATERAEAFLAGVAWLGSTWPNLDELERDILRGEGPADDAG